MSNFIEPNIHPVLVHFAYALSLSAFGVYILGRLLPIGPRKDSTKPAGDWMLALGALAVIGTIAAGFYAYYTVAHDGPSHAAMTTHKNWAVPSGAAILILAVWRYVKRAKAPSGIFLTLLAAAALSLSVTAWWGGNIVYKYGLGVQSLPTVTGDGHDHDHSAGAGHDETKPTHEESAGGEHDEGGHAHKEETNSVKGQAEHDNSDGHHDADSPSLETTENSMTAPAVIADQFGQALKTQDTSTLKALLLPNVIVAEGGNAERSSMEYADHHMKADMAYLANITTQPLSRDVMQSEDMATVITQSEMVGNYKGETVHNRTMETMILHRTEGNWKIAHIHWSSAPLSGGQVPPAQLEKTKKTPVTGGHDNSDGHHDTPTGD